MAFLLIVLPYIAFLGLLVILTVVVVAFFWPAIEWHLLCWLQSRRKAREARVLGTPKVTRLAVRRSR